MVMMGMPDQSTYEQKAVFVCMPGFSLDGKAMSDSNMDFREECQEDGTFTEKEKCKDIDYCEVNEGSKNCADKGSCVDQSLTYFCNCDDGYKVILNEKGYEMCTEINECDTEWGYRSCSEHGKCKDEVTKYSCECDKGYVNVENALGLDSCKSVS